MPAKKKPKPRAKPKAPTKKSSPKTGGSGRDANLVCAECFGTFTTKIDTGRFDTEVGRKFSCPKCGAVYELVSLLEGRITVTVLAKGEARTYGKTYDVNAKGFAPPL